MNQGPGEQSWQPPSQGWGSPNPPPQNQGPQTPPPGWGGPQNAPGWGGQQQYGPPPPGYAPQGPYAPPPGRQNKGALIAVLSAVGALVILSAIVLFALADGDDKKGKPQPAKSMSAQEKAAQAVTKLTAAPGFRYVGSLEAGGDTVKIDLKVTRMGSTSGSYTIGDESAQMMLVDGKTYIKADKDFWEKILPSAEEAQLADYDDEWTRQPNSLSEIDIIGRFTPAAIGKALQAAQPLIAPGGGDVVGSVSGQQAISLEDQDLAQFHITDAAPHRLIKVKTSDYEVGVTELSPADSTAVFDDLRKKVKDDLPGAQDPLVPFSYGKLINNKSKCVSSGCTIEMKVTNKSTRTARVTWNAQFNEKKNGGGKNLGTCSDTRTLKAGGAATFDCRVSGSAWRNWSRTGATRFWVETRATAEAVTQDDVKGILDALDREQQGA